MKVSYITIGQRVTQDKKELSRELRKRMTPAERILWDRLRGRRLAGLRFRRQQVISGFIVDFYCHEAGIAVELDGEVHDRQEDYDRERDRLLGARCIKIMRIKNDEVRFDLPQVLHVIENICREEISKAMMPVRLS